MSIVRRLIERLEPHLPRPRVIYDRAGESPYLSRYYLTAKPPQTGATGQTKRDVERRPPIEIYLHRFHRGDDGAELHNHPWAWSFSLILAGGYREERRIGSRVVSRIVRPLTLNFIGHDDFHRVDLLEDDAWSLFVAGPKVSSWAFWNRETRETIPWREHITRLRGEGWEQA